MLSTLRNAWKVQDLRKKIIWTVFLIAIFRMGSYIPVPGIDTDSLKALTQSGSLVSFYDLISGGSFSRFSIFALGVVPYINASIIMQLLTVAIPKLEQLSKEGDDGRKKIQKITRYASIVIGAITAYGSYVIINNVGALKSNSPVSMFLILLTLVVGSTFLMWLGDQITVKGVGNGTSLIIFANILSSLPMTGYQIYNLSKIGKINVVEVALFIFFTLALLAGVIYLSLAERRITVQYAGKAVGNDEGTINSYSTKYYWNNCYSNNLCYVCYEFPNNYSSILPRSWMVTMDYRIFLQSFQCKDLDVSSIICITDYILYLVLYSNNI